MKKVLLTLCTIFILMSCNGFAQKKLDVMDKSFEELFKQVEPADTKNYVIRLMTEEDNTVITAGTDSLYNSMVASWGIWRYFETPTTSCFLGSKRYTLELMKKHQTYTMSFFPEEYKEDVMAFGYKSGRNSNKMKESKLTYVKTPSGNITYKEAKIVIECKLFEITTVSPNDFYTQQAKNLEEEAYKKDNDYHKIVFGSITNVWVRK